MTEDNAEQPTISMYDEPKTTDEDTQIVDSRSYRDLYQEIAGKSDAEATEIISTNPRFQEALARIPLTTADDTEEVDKKRIAVLASAFPDDPDYQAKIDAVRKVGQVWKAYKQQDKNK